MILNKELILKQLTKNTDYIKKLGVNKLGLFGSYVRNSHNSASDIDILVEFIPGKKNYDNYYELSEFLESLFSAKVEIVTIESLSPYIGPEILKEVQFIEIAA